MPEQEAQLHLLSPRMSPMKEFQAVCLAAILLCIGFGGGWFARSQKAETPQFITITGSINSRQTVFRYDAERGALVQVNRHAK